MFKSIVVTIVLSVTFFVLATLLSSCGNDSAYVKGCQTGAIEALSLMQLSPNNGAITDFCKKQATKQVDLSQPGAEIVK